MYLVSYVLKHPYTVAATLLLIALLGIGAGLRMPVDIFPEINIPVVSVVWTYNGMNAQDIQNRILTLHERQMASLVDDIGHIEATSYDGVGVEKIYLHEGTDVTRAISQLASCALVVLKYLPPGITPPLVQQTAAEQFIALYKALGSGWEHYQTIPPIRQPQPAFIAALRRTVEDSHSMPPKTAAESTKP